MMNQVDGDEDEEEVDHQDTDIKPLGETFPHHQRLFLINFYSLPTFLRTEVPLSF